MKKSVYKGAYKFVSWLSEVTGGAAMIVRWKIALAVVVLGFSAGSITSCKPTCYDPALPPDYEQEQSDNTDDTGGEEQTRFAE